MIEDLERDSRGRVRSVEAAKAKLYRLKKASVRDKRVYFSKYGVPKRLPNGKINPEWTKRQYASRTPEWKDKDRIRHNIWRHKNPHRVIVSGRRANLKHTYGITPEQYESMLRSQNNVCAICGAEHGDRSRRRLAVDHIERADGTVKVRGLLCSACNEMLGSARDNPEFLRNGAAYVESRMD